MMELNHRSRKPEQTVDVKEVLGQPVIAKNGTNVGKVESIHINPKTFGFEGVVVSRGIFNDKQYFGREYLHSISRKGLVLQIVPVTEVIGMEVYDNRGKRVGEVQTVEHKNHSNALSSIQVKRGMFKKSIMVDRDHIKSFANGVMLTTTVKE